jgi:hydrogenase/urease accessory protein HupE
MMNKIFSFLALITLSLFSVSVLAHTGHGDHSAIYASGQAHPAIGQGELVILSLTLAAVFLAIRWLRK